MIRRILVAIALAACAGAYGLAIERATFILISGERKSGTVVFHTEARENLVNNYLNLGTDDGKEMTFPVDQVAVIDFAGGRPVARDGGDPFAFQQHPVIAQHLLRTILARQHVAAKDCDGFHVGFTFQNTAVPSRIPVMLERYAVGCLY